MLKHLRLHDYYKLTNRILSSEWFFVSLKDSSFDHSYRHFKYIINITDCILERV